MNNLILYGELDLYSYLDISNYETEYYSVSVLKNKKFPTKMIYDQDNDVYNFYISISRDIASPEIVNIIIKNTKVIESKYYEIDKVSLFNIKTTGGKIIFPKIKYYSSILTNIISGSILNNIDTTVYVYQNISELNEVFYNINNENYFNIGDLVYIFKINKFLNLSLISVSKIREIYSNRFVISNKKVFTQVNSITSKNEYILTKFHIDSDVDPFDAINEYFTINHGFKDILNYYIRITS